MKDHVALLHSIVLGAGKRLIMADLRAMAEELGFAECRTLVATGNLVFRAEDAPVREIEDRLERAFEKRFDKHVDIMVRPARDWLKLAAENPFPDGNPSDVCVRVMREPLGEDVLGFLEKYRRQEKIAVIGGDLWIDFLGKPSESRLLPVLTTRRLGIGTTRNANTVNGLAEMLR
ncbi:MULTISPECIES: DUF1697 domain-containing protein [Agrobacterium]|jgi:uncharacterized protein (DUF1697 family)|uniref:Uncharacterized protein (DUF1697 family) n=3 Tax=Agrobacterium tumefaciens complex TaxID=1183400 RepID=A0AAW8LNE3_AGRTU|nr:MULTISPECIES: DUF1697 domain-containing protein [Agrobacterium]MCP2134511.1 uncharacterized protein (DUF1697 family) [Rhizobium sp. SLBN-94]TGE80212.1 DUF1697 domain-containing protein [Rhizobium sp. SEMIA 439]AYM05560.1 hypothetical protein At1D1460_13180 [Agrobacterium tumefaciens]KAA1237056.1 DUF1697 domain-containing protein [Agrobacterium tumefaciens]KAB0462204.1 DUF1697 domain-containing protein [Agrobacterium tumefaciens]